MDLPDFLIDHPDGEIRLTGHRISLMQVVDRYNEGLSAEGIAVRYPTLALDQIHKTLAYYLENRAEVDTYIARWHAEIDRLLAAHVPGPAQIRIRKLMEDRSRIAEAT